MRIGGDNVILVDVYIPSLDETYNCRLDESVAIRQIVRELSEMMCKKYKTQLNAQADALYLCSSEQEKVLNSNESLADNNIKNGSKLFLV